MGYSHQVIVHHACKVVGRHPVGLDEHGVVNRIAVPLDMTADRVVDRNHRIARNSLSNDERLASRFRLSDLLRGRISPRSAVVASRLLRRLLYFSHLGKFLGSIERLVGVAKCHQLLDVRLIDAGLLPLALAIRPVRTVDVRALLETDSDPFEGGNELSLGFGRVASLVGIFDSQDVYAMVMVGKQVLKQRIPQGADMEHPSGTGCKSNSD